MQAFSAVPMAQQRVGLADLSARLAMALAVFVSDEYSFLTNGL